MRPANIFYILIALLYSCGTSQETLQNTEKKEPEILVFEEVRKPDSAKVEIPKPVEYNEEVKVPGAVSETLKPGNRKFLLQLGAFTTQERAQIFVKENQSKIAYLMNISLRESDKKFVVRLHPFETREDAEKIRNNIWLIPAFKDAFIITQE